MADLIVGRWGARYRGRCFPASIGRAGVSLAKREGDLASPAGAFELLRVFYRPDRVAITAPALETVPIRRGMEWREDPADPLYNTLRRDGGFGEECLRRADPLYDVVVETSHNAHPARPGAGSAIFVHVWRGPRRPTAGCAAFRLDNVLWVLARWRRGDRLVFQP